VAVSLFSSLMAVTSLLASAVVGRRSSRRQAGAPAERPPDAHPQPAAGAKVPPLAPPMCEAEARFRGLFEMMAQGVVYQDASGAIVDVNPAAERILGLSRDELLGRTSRDRRWRTVREDGSPFPGEQHPAMLALSRGQSVSDVTMGVFDPRAHTLRWILVSGTPIFRPGEERPHQVFTTFVDISESRRAKQALAESEQKLRLFIENVPARIVMLDREMRYLAASRRWLSDYQLDEAAILGRSHYEVFPEIPERWKAIHRHCLSGATESCDEDPFHRADGRVEWVKWEIRPWRCADGAVGGIIIATELVGERKKAQEALRASEELKRAVLDSVAAQIAVLDERGVIIETNEPWRRFAAENGGAAEGTGVGVNYLDVCERSRGEGAEDAAVVADAIRQVLEGRSSRHTLEYSCPTPSQNRRFSLLVTPLGPSRKGVVVAHLESTERERV
jgi:PAS domain S-box-containing protein